MMQIKVERLIHKVGEDSFAITLPKAWVLHNKLKAGDAVEVIINDDVVIRAKTPPETVDEAKS